MKSYLRWLLLISITYLASQILISLGLNLNLSFLLIYFFVIENFFIEEKRNIYLSELQMILFFTLIGFIDDLIQGYLGPSIVSKNITGVFLLLLVKQSFFSWTEPFKGLVIFLFTLLDDTISNLIFMQFFSLNIDHLLLLRESLVRALFNVPVGLILSWRKP